MREKPWLNCSYKFNLLIAGISITKIQGAPPERKYFPAKPNSDQTILPLPGTLNTPPAPVVMPQPSINSSVGYSAVSGLPAGLNGPNVIVVDTSSLKTRDQYYETPISAENLGLTDKISSKLSQKK
jgi:hypothetical protein